MHDIKFIRDNPKKFDEKMKNRNVNISSENILKIDKRKLRLIQTFKSFKKKEIYYQKNWNSYKGWKRCHSSRNVKKLKDQISLADEKIKENENKLRDILINLPNILDDDVPNGVNENDNKVIRSWGKKLNFLLFQKIMLI